MKFFIVFTLLFSSCVHTCTFYKKESKINLLNNAYENVLIALNNDLSENYEIVNRLKYLFTEASAFLFNVTRYTYKYI